MLYGVRQCNCRIPHDQHAFTPGGASYVPQRAQRKEIATKTRKSHKKRH